MKVNKKRISFTRKSAYFLGNSGGFHKFTPLNVTTKNLNLIKEQL